MEGGHATNAEEDKPTTASQRPPTPEEPVSGNGAKSPTNRGIDMEIHHISPPSSPPPMPCFGRAVPSASSAPETNLLSGVKVVPPKFPGTPPAQANGKLASNSGPSQSDQGWTDEVYSSQEAAPAEPQHAGDAARTLLQMLQPAKATPPPPPPPPGNNQPPPPPPPPPPGDHQKSNAQGLLLQQMLQPGGSHSASQQANVPRVVPPPPPKQQTVVLSPAKRQNWSPTSVDDWSESSGKHWSGSSPNQWPASNDDWNRGSGPADEDWDEALPEWSGPNASPWPGSADWQDQDRDQDGGDRSGASGQLQNLLQKIAPQARITTSSTKLSTKASAEILKKIRLVTAENDIGRGGPASEMPIAQSPATGGGASSSNDRSYRGSYRGYGREYGGWQDDWHNYGEPNGNFEEFEDDSYSSPKKEQEGTVTGPRAKAEEEGEDDEEGFLDNWNALFKRNSPLMTGDAKDPFKDLKEMRRRGGKVVWKKNSEREGHRKRYQRRKMEKKAGDADFGDSGDEQADYSWSPKKDREPVDYSWSPQRDRNLDSSYEDHHEEPMETIMYSAGSPVQMQ